MPAHPRAEVGKGRFPPSLKAGGNRRGSEHDNFAKRNYVQGRGNEGARKGKKKKEEKGIGTECGQAIEVKSAKTRKNVHLHTGHQTSAEKEKRDRPAKGKGGKGKRTRKGRKDDDTCCTEQE